MKKRVLITGCGSGFGRDLVAMFLKADWEVIATLRRASQRKSLFAKEAEQYGKALTLLELDVISGENRTQVKDWLRANEGRLDCLVNNAGFGQFGAVEDLSESQIREQFEVNFFGTVLLTRELLPFLRMSRGKIINLSSAAGFFGFPFASLYCASKFAMEGWTEGMALEVKPYGVQCCLVEPGAHRTQFIDNMKWGEISTPSSPYFALTEAAKGIAEKEKGKPGTSSSAVTKTVFNLAQRNKMPLRVRNGTDAKAIHFFKRVLPDPILRGIFSFVFTRFTKKLLRDRPAV